MQSTAPGQNRTGAAVTPDQIDRTFEAVDLFKDAERRDPAELLGNGKLPKFIQFKSHRDFVRETIARETQLRKDGTEFVPEEAKGASSIVYRKPSMRPGLFRAQWPIPTAGPPERS